MSKNLNFKMLTAGIGELTLSQPEKRNAINSAMWVALRETLQAVAKTEGLRVLIVKGDGDHFASGADISEFETLYATPESAAQASHNIAAGLNALANFPFPTIAMIRGACIGGGCGLALCCDVRFADHTAKFAITPAKLGLLYPFNDVQRLIETVGISHAQDILLSARLVRAKPAKRMGLVNDLFKVDNLETKTLAYAQGIAALSPQSLKMTKKMFAAYKAGQSKETDQTQKWFLEGFTGDDFKEGYSAFLAKRKPHFK